MQVISSGTDSSIDSLLVQHCCWDAGYGGAAACSAVLHGQAGGGPWGAPLTGCGQHLHHSWGQLGSVSLQQQPEAPELNERVVPHLNHIDLIGQGEKDRATLFVK